MKEDTQQDDDKQNKEKTNVIEMIVPMHAGSAKGLRAETYVNWRFKCGTQREWLTFYLWKIIKNRTGKYCFSKWVVYYIEN